MPRSSRIAQRRGLSSSPFSDFYGLFFAIDIEGIFFHGELVFYSISIIEKKIHITFKDNKNFAVLLNRGYVLFSTSKL